MITAKLVTYRGLYRTIEVDSINLPSVEGRRGILPNHMPIMIPVEIGIMETVADGQKKRYAISEKSNGSGSFRLNLFFASQQMVSVPFRGNVYFNGEGLG